MKKSQNGVKKGLTYKAEDSLVFAEYEGGDDEFEEQKNTRDTNHGWVI